MKYLLLFLPLLVWAQPINSRVIGATATSLHVGYTAPTAGACTFAATTATPGFVNDLSTALRAGANSDAFIVYGSQPRAFKGAGQAGDREAIIGFRSTIHVLGRTYSLALQADISHTIVVTCPGGSQTVVRHTAKIAGIAPQSPQYLPGAHGNFGAPDFDWTDRTKPVIGTNGEAIYRISDPSDFGFQLDSPFTKMSGAAGYTNAANIMTFGGAGATTSNTNSVFLSLDNVDEQAFTNGGFASDVGFRMSNITMRFFGSGSDASPTNRTLRFCYVGNGVCYTGWKTVVLPQTAAEVLLSAYHPEFPAAGFAGWDKQISGAELPTGQGRVTATGTGVLTLVGALTGSDGNNFYGNPRASIAWFRPSLVGAKLFVTASSPACVNNECTVASYQSPTQVTTIETPTVTSADYRSLSTGFLVEKTTATGSVTFSAGYKTAAFNPVHVGQNKSCSPLVIPGTRAARICVFARNRDYFGTVYRVDPDTHESRPLSLVNIPSTLAGHVAEDMPHGAGFNQRLYSLSAAYAFDSTDPGAFYLMWKTRDEKLALWRIACSVTAATPAGLPWSARPGGAVTPFIDPCAWTNLTKPSQGRDLRTQFLPHWDESKYGSLNSQMELKGVTNGYAVFQKLISGQDRPCGLFIVDIATGTYQRHLNTLNGVPGARFTGCHAQTAAIGRVRVSVARLAIGGLFGGPFTNVIASVKKAGVFNAVNTSLPETPNGSYNATCPGDLAAEWQALGATGENCVTVRITGQPCSNTGVSAEEIAAHPCPSALTTRSYIGANLIPGDTGDNGVPDWTRYTVVKVTDLGDLNADGSNDLELVLLADTATGYSCQANNARGRQCVAGPERFSQANGWSIMWKPRADEFTWDISTGAIEYENEWLTRGHPDHTEGGLFLGIMGFGEYYFARQSGNIGSRQTATFAKLLKFAGSAYPDAANQQSYISAAPVAATGIANKLGSDFPHYNGSTGVTPEAIGQQIGSTMTFALAPGTTAVYRVLPISNTYNPKLGQLVSWHGANVHGEKSSPTTGSHTLTDAQVARSCFAFRAGECRTDSTANDFFAVIPNLDTAKTRCHASQISYSTACILASASTQAHVVQLATEDDTTGRQQRTVSDSLTRPGAQYVYTHAMPFPDSLQILSTVHHLSGWFTGPILIDPGGWTEDAVNRTTYTPFFVSVPANSIVEFGLDTSFRCKYNASSGGVGRDEACKVSAAVIVEATPFKFSHETLAATAALQRVQLPLISGTVSYYRVVTGGVAGPIHAAAIP